MKRSWYKQAALFDNLLQVIVNFLRNSKNYANDAALIDAISQKTQGADDAMSLNAAINKASGILSREQGGMLTQPQQQMLNSLRAKIQDSNMNKPLPQNNTQQSQPTQLNMQTQNNMQPQGNVEEQQDINSLQ